jgi:hypothetical protein
VPVDKKAIFLSDVERKGIDVIVEKGFAETPSGAVRIAIRQFVAAIQFGPPLVTPMTPAG